MGKGWGERSGLGRGLVGGEVAESLGERLGGEVRWGAEIGRGVEVREGPGSSRSPHL